MQNDVVLVIVVATALAFDFTNGFHDTANVVATSISTRAMPPRFAVGYAAALNFVGAFISLAVATTVAQDVVNAGAITPTVVFAGLIGAISWNLITWCFGLPSSSSHALIGGVVGAAFVAAGPSAILGAGILGKVLIPAVDRADCRLHRRGDRDRDLLPRGRARSARACRARLPARAGRVRRAPRARPRDKRRPEDDGRHHPRSDREREPGRGLDSAHLGHRHGGERDRRSAPTSAGGASSARWAPGSSRWTRPRGSLPRVPERR